LSTVDICVWGLSIGLVFFQELGFISYLIHSSSIQQQTLNHFSLKCRTFLPNTYLFSNFDASKN